jgi:hypothetical protein
MDERNETSVQGKSNRLETARAKLQQFVDGGGDLKSPQASPLGIEFLYAYDDLAREFGYEILKPTNQAQANGQTDVQANEIKTDNKLENLEDFLKLFTFDKKRDLEKYCREVVIDSSVFAAFIMACESGNLPYLHRIHYRDYVPEHLYPTDEDLAALASNPVGSLQPGAQKAISKMSQIFKDRRYLVGHIFYVHDLSKWHFFQFDQRDLEDDDNHWKEGAHIHFLNWLWPNYDVQTVWQSFTTGKVKLNGSLHVRYYDAARSRTQL